MKLVKLSGYNGKVTMYLQILAIEMLQVYTLHRYEYLHRKFTIIFQYTSCSFEHKQ